MPQKEPLSSFGLPGEGIATRRAKNIADAVKIAKESHRKRFPVIPIGKGTNCAFLESPIPAIFLRSTDKSLKIKERKSNVLMAAGAGLPWDTLVRLAVENGWSGAECLSGIPGSCGAAPYRTSGRTGLRFRIYYSPWMRLI